MTFDYENWLKAAHGRLETLYKQKAAIESEISKLERAIQGFAPLVKNPSKWFGAETGITDAVRAVLKSDTHRIFTATEIRDELVMRGVPLKQKNPLATIYQILARLVDNKEAKIDTHEAGRNRYKYDTTIEEKREAMEKLRREETEKLQKMVRAEQEGRAKAMEEIKRKRT